MTGTRRSAKPRGILYYLGLGVSAGLLGLLLLVGALVIVIPAVSGSTPMTILTSSMEPTYPPGTLIIVQPVDVNDIAIGDAITYQIESGKPEVVTHRVVSISSIGAEKSFITKGDNNAVADPSPVQPVQVRGSVWYAVPYIGYANTLVNGDNRSVIVPVIAMALFAYAGWMFASGIAQTRRRRRRVRERELVSGNQAQLS
jgi:signal peptidase I